VGPFLRSGCCCLGFLFQFGANVIHYCARAGLVDMIKKLEPHPLVEVDRPDIVRGAILQARGTHRRPRAPTGTRRSPVTLTDKNRHTHAPTGACRHSKANRTPCHQLHCHGTNVTVVSLDMSNTPTPPPLCWSVTWGLDVAGWTDALALGLQAWPVRHGATFVPPALRGRVCGRQGAMLCKCGQQQAA
jgi:hypothetical protein